MTTTVTGMLEEASITVQFCWVYPSEHKPSAARHGGGSRRRLRHGGGDCLAGWVGERPADIVNGVISNCIRLALLLLLALVYTDCWCASQSRGGGSSRATKTRQSFEARHELHSFSSLTNSDFIVFSLLISITISFLKAGLFPFPGFGFAFEKFFFVDNIHCVNI